MAADAQSPNLQRGELVTLYGSDWALAVWSSLCGNAAEANVPALLAMWVLMSAAMMLPTLIPTLHVYLDLTHCKGADEQGFVALVMGFLFVWLSFSLLGAGLQRLLSEQQLVAADGSSRSLWLTAGLLLLAGGYQFSTLKQACLNRCRHPLSFFLQYWQVGNRAALSMGIRLGILCLGCCWVLMLLGFIGGTMNLLWMGVATLFMVLEKLPDIGRYLTQPAGWILLLSGVATTTHALAELLGE